MKTTVVVKEGVEQKWFVVDATDQVLGRLASKVAHVLRGKHKPYYAPHLDVGDYIIVTNAEKIHATGNKLLDKTYFRHTGYPSGLRTRTLGKVLSDKPTDVIEMAVKGMLPKNPLGREMYRKLKVYAGPDHDHAAQKPEPLDLSLVK